MPGPSFLFLGHSQTGYPGYADTADGRMLVAEPGGSYGIRAIEPGIAVPPPDGLWGSVRGAPPPSPPPVPAVPPAPAVPALAGGDR